MKITIGPEEFFHKAKSKSRNKGNVNKPLTSKQLAAGCTVFGDGISPKCGQRVTTSNLGSALKQELEPETEEVEETIANVIEEMSQAIQNLGERVSRLESDEINEEDKRWRGKTNGQHVSPTQFFKRGAQ